MKILRQTAFNEKGMALFVTLAVISVLVAAAIHLGKTTGASVLLTIKGIERFEAEQAALSGIHFARLVLMQDAALNERDSIQETWSNPELLSQALERLGFEKESITLSINDELGKICVNSLIYEFPGSQLNSSQRKVWEKYLNIMLSEEEDTIQYNPEEIINSVKDWLDTNDDDAITGLSGAESEFYKNLDPPYPCANAPLNIISELRLVKGIAPDNPFAFEQNFTVFGMADNKGEEGGFGFPGRVNINTASYEVLAALLPEGMDERAQELVEYREQKGEEDELFVNVLDNGWYEQVLALTDREKDRLDRLIRYSSDLFKVECSAWKNDVQVTLVAFVKRERKKETGKWTCRIVRMERGA
ncbi:MAG: general secretion pathway protein GspK [Desulfobacteraceae bacterium]|nr:general secretion pathway protein GspK [Desulfobacteraceae bacterium]